jgi:multisubunit Na+/H+ antiporter MnhG subunit
MSYSIVNAVNDLQKGFTKEWDDKELDIFNSIKFLQIFLILITCTASYLILAAATNPWILSVFNKNMMFSVVIAGIIAMDSFFAFSAFFGFLRIS